MTDSSVIFGFDSAWTDNPRAPGAICALIRDPGAPPRFVAPQLTGFDAALSFIDSHRAGRRSLVALDQPTVVPNLTGSRPADRVAASVVSYIGGGVQPANRGKRGMFDDAAPVWRFLDGLGAVQDPQGRPHHGVMEVFPALALPAFDPAFGARLGAPKYNPANRRKYRPEDWVAVCRALAVQAQAAGQADLAAWAEAMAALSRPVKADQDRLDAALCALIGLIWDTGMRPAVMFGDLAQGYIVTPVSAASLARLEAAAARREVPIRQRGEGV
ncbi:DUF429 domain-containing protein [Pseudooceanicola marinus]|uniref:DUF429 domain-containing protein n=1 Tax=Pseudooceanicola marinus TaxID=396013 RepID=UPI001CD58C38|nr:DUF429 domain-containing protein [Pseudooceanicola marinus]MCA1336715.1 DUF429 domain-containing protein [Pseudooceanicola marinus]